MNYVLDTNVYLEAVRSEQHRERFRTAFLPLLPATFLAAVVAYELAVDAADRRTRGLVEDFVRPLERSGRIVTPSFEDWLDAARIVTAIYERDRSWRSKLPTLLNDVLIALSARRIGATLLTFNAADFRLIRRHRDFALRVLGARARGTRGHEQAGPRSAGSPSVSPSRYPDRPGERLFEG